MQVNNSGSCVKFIVVSDIKLQSAASKSAGKPQVARGHLHCTPASTANHDLSSGWAHTHTHTHSAIVRCMGNCEWAFLHEGGSTGSAVEPRGEMVHSGARGGDSSSRGARSRPHHRSGPLSSDKSRGPRFKAGAVVRGRRGTVSSTAPRSS